MDTTSLQPLWRELFRGSVRESLAHASSVARIGTQETRAWERPIRYVADNNEGYVGVVEFGPRGACRGVHAVDMTEELLSTGRRGDLADLVWVPGGGRGGRRIEPYCLGRSD